MAGCVIKHNARPVRFPAHWVHFQRLCGEVRDNNLICFAEMDRNRIAVFNCVNLIVSKCLSMLPAAAVVPNCGNNACVRATC